MPAVRIADKRVWVGDESRALLSGEVHYWRLDPSAWPKVLRAAGDLGLDVLSTYVCWDFHETGPREFDFCGATNPRRNLVEFLDAVQRAGLWLLLRPGPYIYAEWPNSGVPDRVVRWHRLHPSFKEEAAAWMAAVVDAVRPHLATNGGPIVLLQADNEADPWPDVYASQLGDLFAEFLARRYRDVGALNAVWEASLDSFAEARPVELAGVRSRGHRNRYLDWCRFRHWYATEVVRWNASEYRRLGVDVPIYANTYLGWTVQDWRAIEAVCDLAGPDIYPTSRLASSPDEHRGVLDAVRYARTYSKLPFIPEFESGIWHGWHAGVGTLTAENYELNAYSALQAGVAGWNWYMLASRDSWYMSPLTELGRSRPELLPAFADLVRVFRELDPASLDKLTDTAVTVDVLERAAGLDDDGQAVPRGLYFADVHYELFDVDAGNIEKPLLLYAGGRWLSSSGQKRLAEYVERGGTLVFFQALPVLDDTFGPRNLLGLQEPDGITSAAEPRRLRVRLIDRDVELSSWAVFDYARVPGEPVLAERIAPRPPRQEGGHLHVQLPVGERLTVGYIERRGLGRLIVLGVTPTPDLLIGLHAALGVRIACRSLTSGIQSAVFRRGAEHYLIVTNTRGERADARIRLDLGAQVASARDLRTGVESPTRDGEVFVSVPARSGTAVRLR